MGAMQSGIYWKIAYHELINFEAFDVENLSVAGGCAPDPCINNSLPNLENPFENPGYVPAQ